MNSNDQKVSGENEQRVPEVTSHGGATDEVNKVMNEHNQKMEELEIMARSQTANTDNTL